MYNRWAAYLPSFNRERLYKPSTQMLYACDRSIHAVGMEIGMIRVTSLRLLAAFDCDGLESEICQGC